MADEEWIDSAWGSVVRGLRVSNFLQQVVRVFGVFVVLGFGGVLVAAFSAEERLDRITLLLSAVGGFFFWSMSLGALFVLATLLEIQSNTLAVTLSDEEASSAPS